jgi:asparagine synthase (glutamine-hydrolysing)
MKMGTLIAAVNKKKENVVPMIISMLLELAHRGNNGCGISTSSQVTKTATNRELDNIDWKSDIALGHNFSFILPKDQQQPVKGNRFTIVFEGRFYPSPNPPEPSEVQEIVEFLSNKPLDKANLIIKKKEGSYVFAIVKQDRLIVGRDVFGAIPLYYGENETVCAVASERKSLWKIGLRNVKSFPPGQLANVNKQGFSFHSVKQLRIPPKQKLDIETAIQALQTLLMESTRKQVSDLESVGVAFSGGVDSSIIAVLAKHVGINVQLISVGLENQLDVMFTKQAAEVLDLPIHIQTYNMRELQEIFEKVLWLTEEINPINATIAVPFFWLAETSRKLGHPVLLAGQGADELFGGYQKYLTEYKKSGAEGVEQKMFIDIKNSYSTNFQRDNQVCAYHAVELRLPFIDRAVVDFALRLPIRFKINSSEDKLRKQILRRVAHNIGIPSFIADKPKKAIQYTTGVTKALNHIAKNNNLTLREYTQQKYYKIYKNKR